MINKRKRRAADKRRLRNCKECLTEKAIWMFSGNEKICIECRTSPHDRELVGFQTLVGEHE